MSPFFRALMAYVVPVFLYSDNSTWRHKDTLFFPLTHTQTCRGPAEGCRCAVYCLTCQHWSLNWNREAVCCCCFDTNIFVQIIKRSLALFVVPSQSVRGPKQQSDWSPGGTAGLSFYCRNQEEHLNWTQKSKNCWQTWWHDERDYSKLRSTCM